MARLARAYTDDYDRTHLKFGFAFDRELIDAIKQFPGVRWHKELKQWLIPRELEHEISCVANGYGQRPVSFVKPLVRLHGLPRQDLFPYQQDFLNMLNAQHAGMACFEPGMGKSAPSLLGSELPTLIICPSNVRYTWPAEIKRVIAPEAALPVIETQKDVLDRVADFTVCSYGCLAAVANKTWRSVIVDESHNIKNDAAARSKRVRELVDYLRPGLHSLALLTGTPIGNRPEDLWFQLDTLYPGRFGSFYQFTQRYCSIEWAWTDAEGRPKGRKLVGLHPLYGDELRERLKHVMVRAMKSDWAHLLPPLTLLPRWERAEGYSEQQAAFLLNTRGFKVKKAVELATELKEQHPKVAIVCYYRETAKQIADLLGVGHIDGTMPADDRHRRLTELAGQPNSTLVVTMKSIQEGLNMLTPFNQVILAELYWQPLAIVQVLSRFHRLTSRSPVTVHILGMLGSQDELVYHSLTTKIKDENAVIKAGAVEAAVENADEAQTLDISNLDLEE